MKLSTLKNEFTEALHRQYPEDEIQSFFTLLTEHFLKFSRLQVAMNAEMKVSKKDAEKFSEAIDRLKIYEPIQYIIGETEFYGLPLKLNKHTLIPRPETEELVAWILQNSKTQLPMPKTILDIGTGSGCIAIALAKNLPNCVISALDISEDAIKLARQNASLNNMVIDFFPQDILKMNALPSIYDVIVSNPPYVRELEREVMHKNILDHEPASALFVTNREPLVFYRKIARLAKNALTTNGILYFEINEYLSKEMAKMLKEEGFKSVEIKKDMFRKDRMIKAKINA